MSFISSSALRMPNITSIPVITGTMSLNILYMGLKFLKSTILYKNANKIEILLKVKKYKNKG